MGLKGEAAIVGYVEWKPERRRARPPEFTIEQWARLTKGALDDAGVSVESVNGIVTSGIQESGMFVPATVSEYLGIPIDFAEYVDLGGATCAGMIWRAAAAVELGLADVVVCAAPSSPVPRPPISRPPDSRRMFGASSNA
jgi:acetyl-CoA C-acetyltransferase